MSEVVLSLQNLHKRFGALQATNDVSLDLKQGEIHALIGPNGAGKSTLIGQIAGSLRPDEGRVYLADAEMTGMSIAQRARLGLGRSFQVSSLAEPLSESQFSLLETRCPRPESAGSCLRSAGAYAA